MAELDCYCINNIFKNMEQKTDFVSNFRWDFLFVGKYLSPPAFDAKKNISHFIVVQPLNRPANDRFAKYIIIRKDFPV